MEERGRGKRNMHSEKNKDERNRQLEAMTEEERDDYFRELRRERRLRRQKRERWKKLAVLGATAVISFVVVVGAVSGITRFVITKSSGSGTASNKDENKKGGGEATAEASAQTDLLAEANLKAAQYDYGGAVQLLKSDSSYDKNADFQAAVKKYEETKATCVSWPLEEVTHVFYHTLIKDPAKSFDGDYKEGDYNQVMTTIDEFNKITQTMYDKGYVMVSIKDMAIADENGNITPGEILLPPGKIPFVLSQDDVCYYHYMDGDGYATKLVVDAEGKVRNEYVEDDGTVSVGDYDMVPLIDRFVE